MMPTPEPSTSTASPAATMPSSARAARPLRVLACLLCQQRKVKCNRTFPCSNCVRSQAQCVPAAAVGPRQRRRRFPERELLDRLRRYESVLRQNNIPFEPLHQDPSSTEKKFGHADVDGGEYAHDEEQPEVAGSTGRSSSPSTTAKSETIYNARDFWYALDEVSRDVDDGSSDSSPEDVRENMIQKAWVQMHLSDDHLLFGSRKTGINLATLHPEQVHIFKLWQIYLDNVNPLLKVTHTPTLQARIIDAASDVASIKPSLAALMFSIYCMSVLSLTEDECYAIFRSPKEDLMKRYQLGCQQALLTSGFLRSSDRHCLTALYLYLISVRPDTDPASLSSMLGLAIRIAQRMGLQNEATVAKCSALEAEMRRRLWWSLILFDTRICELADYKGVMLAPTWGCRTPLNVNDFDLQPEMKNPPAVQGKSTEALFVVVRSEMGKFVRHSIVPLDFISPALKTGAKDADPGHVLEGDEMVAQEQMIEDKYLKFCNPENPLHFMTIWMTRASFAKSRLVAHWSIVSRQSVQQTDAQCDAAIGYARSMLECDTKLMTSPLTTGFLWLIHFYFPFPAYLYMVQDLKRRPISDHAEQNWEIMSENYEIRFKSVGPDDSPFFSVFAKFVLQAWKAREAVLSQPGKPLTQPRIVSDVIQKNAMMMPHDEPNADKPEKSDEVLGMGVDDFWMSLPMEYGGNGLPHGMSGPGDERSGLGLAAYPSMHEPAALDSGGNPLGWNLMSMEWDSMNSRGW